MTVYFQATALNSIRFTYLYFFLVLLGFDLIHILLLSNDFRLMNYGEKKMTNGKGSAFKFTFTLLIQRTSENTTWVRIVFFTNLVLMYLNLELRKNM